MTAYVVFIRDRMKDPEEFKTYSKMAGAARGEHALTPLAYYGAVETWEGDEADGVVIVQFPTVEAARNWYESPEYQAAKAHRLKGADYRVIVVEGL
jgi:uncharacterized protein (DUF1330 family)